MDPQNNMMSAISFALPHASYTKLNGYTTLMLYFGRTQIRIHRGSQLKYKANKRWLDHHNFIIAAHFGDGPGEKWHVNSVSPMGAFTKVLGKPKKTGESGKLGKNVTLFANVMLHLGLTHGIQGRRHEDVELDEWCSALCPFGAGSQCSRCASYHPPGSGLVASELFQEVVKGLFVRPGRWRGTAPYKRR
ncbi:hypothetical protein BJV78DRAFT_1153006 [Lactifluus subvellereus]|nr:hypothetical protein BJV78DRAFT_1153006 [Lactifluus subvellereus]